MSQTQTPSTFAFGANTLENCSCPAVAAGMDPTASHYDGHTPGLLGAAEQYDAILSEQIGGWDGLVEGEVAKSAWMAMLDNATDEEIVEAGEMVAKELGWMEDDN